MNELNVKQVFEHWNKGAAQDWKSCLLLLSGKQYRQSLFFLHLTLEKKLKALVVLKTKKHAPFTHNLLILAGTAGLNLDKVEVDWLTTATTFNLSGRYPDEKQKLTSRFTKRFTEEWVKNAKQLIQKLNKQLKSF